MNLPGQVENGDEPRSRRIKSVEYFRDGGRWHTDVSYQTYTGPSADEVDRVAHEIAEPATKAIWLTLRSHAYHQRDHEEYILDMNGKEAAIRAGYSARTAAAQAVRLLMNVNVKAAVAAGAAKQHAVPGVHPG